MSTAGQNIREVILALVGDMEAKAESGNLQQSTLLSAAKQKLVPRFGDVGTEQQILTQWQELFRTGLLAWGYNLANPNPPFFHFTESGRRALENATRDPGNPAGYIRHLRSRATIDPVTQSYLLEALNCYVAGLYKAAAVMIGTAAESAILFLRDLVVARLEERGEPISRDLKDWKIKTVTVSLSRIFDGRIDSKAHPKLKEQYESYWIALSGQLRITRNEAGHPTSIEPVTADTVHASLLVFPELAALATSLGEWVAVG